MFIGIYDKELDRFVKYQSHSEFGIEKMHDTINRIRATKKNLTMAFRSYDNSHFKGDMVENERAVRLRRSPRSSGGDSSKD